MSEPVGQGVIACASKAEAGASLKLFQRCAEDDEVSAELASGGVVGHTLQRECGIQHGESSS